MEEKPKQPSSFEEYTSFQAFLCAYEPRSTDPSYHKTVSRIASAFNRSLAANGYAHLKTVPFFTAISVHDNSRHLLCPLIIVQKCQEFYLTSDPEPKEDEEKEAKTKEKETKAKNPLETLNREDRKEKKRLEKEQKRLEKELKEKKQKEALLQIDKESIFKIIPLKQEEWTAVAPLAASKYHKLHGHFRRLEAINNVISNGSPLLQAMKKAIESGKIKRLLAFDVEAFEHNQKFLLELGAAVYEIPQDSASAPPTIEPFHFVMKENVKKKNGKFCANNRDNYSFGKSKFLPTNQVFSWLLGQMKKPGTGIIGHNVSADLRYLEQAKNFKETGARFPVPCDTPFHQKYFKGLSIFDTQAIFREVHLRPHEEKLEKLLIHYGIPHNYLHNAGNDAYFTLMTALKLVDLPFQPFSPKSSETRNSSQDDVAESPFLKEESPEERLSPKPCKRSKSESKRASKESV